MAFAAAVAGAHIAAHPPAAVLGDAFRYLSLALNVVEHGVISDRLFDPASVPVPGLGSGGILNALELALAFVIDPEGKRAVVCEMLAARGSGPACGFSFPGLQVLHGFELGAALVLIWALAREITNNALTAWIALGLAGLCGQLWAETDQALTEPLYLCLGSAALLLWVKAWKSVDARALWGVLGLLLGGLTLVRPSAAILLPIAMVTPWLAARYAPGRSSRDRPGPWPEIGFLVLGMAVLLLPWGLRGALVVGRVGLADPGHLEAALAHRQAYDAMSWAEWRMGWIFYLPDFGDSLAAALFPEDALRRLGWSEQSYYVYGRDVLHAAYRQAAGGRPAIGLILHDGFVAQPVKHLAVGLLLIWRGLFVGKLWGLVAWLLVPFGLRACSADTRRLILLTLIPVLAMALAHGFLSVSISRYNVLLVAGLAIAAAVVAERLLRLGRGLVWHA